MGKARRVKANECKTELVETRRAPTGGEGVAEAIEGLAALQQEQLAAGKGGSQEGLRRMQESGRE